MAKTGYCSVCKRPDVKQINKAIEDNWSYYMVRDTFADPPAKDTFYKHKKHVTSPLITAADAARANPVIKPRTNKEVLEAIRDIGLQNAMENPEKITANHAIRAASVLAEKEKKQPDIILMMGTLLQGPPPALELDDTIEAEYEEVNG